MSETKLGLGTADTQISVPSPGGADAGHGEPARGDSIGRFVVLGLLGKGGMGVVCSAYDPQLDRKVAIKLLRADAARSNAADARTRLLREAQALAKINHPNVIKVHEVGTLGDQVYVAMEFADGGTLKRWLGAERRDLRAILDVFVQAGRGLAAAHEAGLVHRDFKPDNVLLANDGSVRVTDFGLVSVLAAPGDTREVAPADLPLSSSETPLSEELTRTGSILGTPSYMAPEQFAAAAATEATDQFAFCIALYEAVYDARPFAGTSYQELSSNVLLGQLAPPPRGARVPGWLRRVLLRGLAHDARDRFPSMAALLAALSRDAVRRRRTIAAIAVPVVAIAIAGGIVAARPSRSDECSAGGSRVASVWNPTRRLVLQQAFAASQRPHAAASFARASEMIDDWTSAWQTGYADACKDTRVRAEQSEHLLDLRMQCLTARLEDARATIDVLAAGGGDAIDKALDALVALPPLAPCADASALLADVPPPDQELVRVEVAGVRARVDQARALARVARYKPALAAALDALAAARATSYAPVVAEAQLQVARVQRELVDRAGVASAREAMHLAAEAGDAPVMVDAAANLVYLLAAVTSDYDAASEVAGLVEPLAHHSHVPPEHVMDLESSIALLDSKRGRLADAQARLERTLAAAGKQLATDDAVTLRTISLLALVLRDRGKLDESLALYERVLAAAERVFGKDHPRVASAINDIGVIYRRQNKLDDAKQAFERALAIRIAALGPDHADVATSLNSLGNLYADEDKLDTALSYYQQSLALEQKIYGVDTLETITGLINVASTVELRGNHDAARTQFEHALAILDAHPQHDVTIEINLLNNLANVLRQQDHHEEALAVYQRAEKLAIATSGPQGQDYVDIAMNEASTLSELHRVKDAAALEERLVDAAKKAYGPTHPRVAGLLMNLAHSYEMLGRLADAIPMYEQSLAMFEAGLGKNHAYVSYPLIGLTAVLPRVGRARDAVAYGERALAIRTSAKMPPHFLAETHEELSRALSRVPGQRARARDEAKLALGLFEQAGEANRVAEVRQWLASH